MKSIYSSKLYIASKRKSQIRAAMLSASNLALAQQIADDLDDQYKTRENLGLPEKETEVKKDNFDDLMVNEEINPESDLVKVDDLDTGSRPSSRPSAPHRTPSHEGPEEEPEHNNEDVSELIPESPANAVEPKEEKPVEESTQVTSSTTVETPEKVVNLNILKGDLNAVSETAGVSRIQKKENEIWIYYKDEVNLNNIMTDVIELVTESEFAGLEFNRLARSDNAIVFEVVEQSSDRPNKTIEASRQVQPVDVASKVSSGKPQTSESGGSKVDKFAKAVKMIKSLREDGPFGGVKDAVRDGNTVKVTFADGHTACITEEAIDSGRYVEDMVNLK